MCTPFCEDNCPYRGRHNNLILSLVKLQESGKQTNIEDWKKLIITAKGMCDLNQPLEDPDPDFDYPLLHWAATLGKVRAVQWLLKQDFISLRKSPTGGNFQGKSNATIIFSMVRFLHEGVTTRDPQKVLKVFLKILDLLLKRDPDLLLVQEGLNNDTVLHLCARGEEDTTAPFLKYLKGILVKLQDMSKENKTLQLQNILRKENGEGDTFIDVVSKFQNQEKVADLHEFLKERFPLPKKERKKESVSEQKLDPELPGKHQASDKSDQEDNDDDDEDDEDDEDYDDDDDNDDDDDGDDDNDEDDDDEDDDDDDDDDDNDDDDNNDDNDDNDDDDDDDDDDNDDDGGGDEDSGEDVPLRVALLKRKKRHSVKGKEGGSGKFKHPKAIVSDNASLSARDILGVSDTGCNKKEASPEIPKPLLPYYKKPLACGVGVVSSNYHHCKNDSQAAPPDSNSNTMFKAKDSVHQLVRETERKLTQEKLKLKKARSSLARCERKIRQIQMEKEKRESEVERLEETVRATEEKLACYQEFLGKLD